MDFKSITLILTQADVGKKAVVSAVGKFSRLEKVDLFFVHRGVELVDQNWSDLPQGKRVYCAFDHKRLRGPTPHPSNRAGGLAILGQWVRENDGMLCYPNGRGGPVADNRWDGRIGIGLDGDPELAGQGLRLAVGLAGCDLPVFVGVSCPAGWQTLYDLGNLNRETGAFIEALVSLGCAQGNQPLPDLDSLGPGIVLRL
ncbi:MAG TPA: hypothetical protein HPQ00_12500 [Magnetococcales bacterium]|nr:hypothetical protein [Magnetococcales bacterium]